MVEKILSFEEQLTPIEFLTLMFEKTDEFGVVYIPGWYSDNNKDYKDNSFKCEMNWNYSNFENLKKEFKILYSNIEKISAVYDKLDGTRITAEKVLGAGECLESWDVYIRPFDVSEIDMSNIIDIKEKIVIINEARDISKKFANEEHITPEEKEFLKTFLDVSLTEEEYEIYKNYKNSIYAESEKRVGENICAYDFVIRAMRVCKLLSLNAPETVVSAEARELIAAMAIHKYGIKKECVNNEIRLNMDRLELMTEEELDEYSRPLKTNSRKSLAPLFVYLILKEHTNSKKHLRQREILNFLKDYPYEIVIDRKTLSRIIHNLVDSQLSIYSYYQKGTWLEQET